MFLACSFWMVTNLWLIGRKEDARAMFERLLALRTMWACCRRSTIPRAKRMLGNFPQALSHIALVHCGVHAVGHVAARGRRSEDCSRVARPMRARSESSATTRR